MYSHFYIFLKNSVFRNHVLKKFLHTYMANKTFEFYFIILELCSEIFVRFLGLKLKHNIASIVFLRKYISIIFTCQ